MPYYMVMFAAGLGIPMLAALNAGLGRYLGSPAMAAMILFAVAFCVAGAVTLLTATAPSAIFAAPKPLFLGGLFVAFYVLSITWIAPIIGVGPAVFMVLLGQIVAAAAIDHFGLMGAAIKPLTMMRMAGIAVMVAGLVLIQKG